MTTSLKRCAAALWLLVALVVVAAVAAGNPSPALAKGEPVSSDPYAEAISVDWTDGEYFIDVELAGGSGRASVESPTKLTVANGKAVLTLMWSSPNYDYMVVSGKQYLPVNPGGNSTFQVPVLAFDKAFPVVADTTAMSEPHEIDYEVTIYTDTLRTFDATAAAGGGSASAASSAAAASSDSSASASSSEGSAAASGQTTESMVPWYILIGCVLLAAVAVGLIVGLLRGYRNR